ncbi:hypothetical protein [Photobacterium leiognathi]|nr:hypothetical protein [Photobacterium leiognathi]
MSMLIPNQVEKWGSWQAIVLTKALGTTIKSIFSEAFHSKDY